MTSILCDYLVRPNRWVLATKEVLERERERKAVYRISIETSIYEINIYKELWVWASNRLWWQKKEKDFYRNKLTRERLSEWVKVFHFSWHSFVRLDESTRSGWLPYVWVQSSIHLYVYVCAVCASGAVWMDCETLFILLFPCSVVVCGMEEMECAHTQRNTLRVCPAHGWHRVRVPYVIWPNRFIDVSI